jgi:heavy metal translocating P-type ATPase
MPLASFLAIRYLLVILPLLGLAVGFGFRFAGMEEWSGWIWGLAAVPVLVALTYQIVASLRRGDFGLDIVAALSMSAALIFGEELAAVVVALMYAGGQYLEDFAEGRARREMTALLSRVPRVAMRHRNGGLEEIKLDDIRPGDQLLIRQGEGVPVDGKVSSGVAILDQSVLTGEAMPVRRKAGDSVMSGSTNAGDAFDIVASQTAAASTYAGIVRLVEQAQQSKAPMARLADRFAIVFLAVTVVIAGAAWLLTGDPIRAVAVLVIATPCPLILALPVAIVSGLSRAAKEGILIKGGDALERMAKIHCLVIDKTGTITHGRAKIVAVNTTAGHTPEEVLRLAASLDQASNHIVAQTIVATATARALALDVPVDVTEAPGEGVEGLVDGKRVVVGGRKFVRSKVAHAAPSNLIGSPVAGSVISSVAIDGEIVGEIVLADDLRPGMADLLQALRGVGIRRIVLATGDRAEVAKTITAGLGIDAIRADLGPDQKVLVVVSERKNGPVMMVGDGVNDAPALAAADVGVAMGARGAAASAEAADVVLLVDRLDRILRAIRISQRSSRIALESVYAGIGLSIVGMIIAAFGYITPVQGALLQEAIDVAVILNALRALKG